MFSMDTGCNVEIKWIKLLTFSVVQGELKIFEITCKNIHM